MKRYIYAALKKAKAAVLPVPQGPTGRLSSPFL